MAVASYSPHQLYMAAEPQEPLQHSCDSSGCSTTSKLPVPLSPAVRISKSTLRSLRKMLNRPYQMETCVYSQLIWMVLKITHRPALQAEFHRTFSLDVASLQELLSWASLQFEASFNDELIGDAPSAIDCILQQLEYINQQKMTSHQAQRSAQHQLLPLLSCPPSDHAAHDLYDSVGSFHNLAAAAEAPAQAGCSRSGTTTAAALANATRAIAALQAFLTVYAPEPDPEAGIQSLDHTDVGAPQPTRLGLRRIIMGQQNRKAQSATQPPTATNQPPKPITRHYSWETISYMTAELSDDSDVSRIHAVRSRKAGSKASVASLKSALEAGYAHSTGSDTRHQQDAEELLDAADTAPEYHEYQEEQMQRARQRQQPQQQHQEEEPLVQRRNRSRALFSRARPNRSRGILKRLKDIVVEKCSCIHPRTHQPARIRTSPTAIKPPRTTARGPQPRRSTTQTTHTSHPTTITTSTPYRRQSFEAWIRTQEPNTPTASIHSPKLSGNSANSSNRPVSSDSSKILLTAHWVNTGQTYSIDAEVHTALHAAPRISDPNLPGPLPTDYEHAWGEELTVPQDAHQYLEEVPAPRGPLPSPMVFASPSQHPPTYPTHPTAYPTTFTAAHPSPFPTTYPTYPTNPTYSARLEEIHEADSWASVASRPTAPPLDLELHEAQDISSTPLTGATAVTTTSSQSPYPPSPFALALEQEFHDHPDSFSLHSDLESESPPAPGSDADYPHSHHQHVYHTPMAVTAPPQVISPIFPSDTAASTPYTRPLQPLSPSMAILRRSAASVASWASDSPGVAPPSGTSIASINASTCTNVSTNNSTPGMGYFSAGGDTAPLPAAPYAFPSAGPSILYNHPANAGAAGSTRVGGINAGNSGTPGVPPIGAPGALGAWAGSWASELSQLTSSPQSSTPYLPRIRTSASPLESPVPSLHPSHSLNHFAPRRDSWSSDYSPTQAQAQTSRPLNLSPLDPSTSTAHPFLLPHPHPLPSTLRSATSMPSRLGGRRHMARAASARTSALANITTNTTNTDLQPSERDISDAATDRVMDPNNPTAAAGGAAAGNVTGSSSNESPSPTDGRTSTQELDIDTHFLSDRGATITASTDLDAVVITTPTSAAGLVPGSNALLMSRPDGGLQSAFSVPDPMFHFTLPPMAPPVPQRPAAEQDVGGAGEENVASRLRGGVEGELSRRGGIVVAGGGSISAMNGGVGGVQTGVAAVPELPAVMSSSEHSDSSGTRGGLSGLGFRLHLAAAAESGSSAEEEEAPETLCHFGSFTGATEPAYLAGQRAAVAPEAAGL